MNDKAKLAMTELLLGSSQEQAAIWRQLAERPIKGGGGATSCDFHVEEGPVPGCELCEEINAPEPTASVSRFPAPSGNTDNDRFFAHCPVCGWTGAHHSNRTVEGRRLADRDARNHRCPEIEAVRER